MIKYLLIFTLLFSANAFSFEGLVAKVYDGDTIKVINTLGVAEKIRITKIDAPELKAFRWGEQPYAQQAKIALANLCADQIATVIRKSKDKYGRTIAAVSCKNTDVTDYMIKNGNAWAYRYSATKALKNLQATAKAQNIGLWALDTPVEPIIWRKNGLH